MSSKKKLTPAQKRSRISMMGSIASVLSLPIAVIALMNEKTHEGVIMNNNQISSRNNRVVLVETEHEDGYVEKNLTTLDRLEEEWGDEYRDYVDEYSDQEKDLTRQVKKKGIAWFETKYRNITVNQIVNARDVNDMVAGVYDDPAMVCRSMESVPQFTWKPDLTPEEVYPQLEAMKVPREYYRNDNAKVVRSGDPDYKWAVSMNGKTQALCSSKSEAKRTKRILRRWKR